MHDTPLRIPYFVELTITHVGYGITTFVTPDHTSFIRPKRLSTSVKLDICQFYYTFYVCCVFARLQLITTGRRVLFLVATDVALSVAPLFCPSSLSCKMVQFTSSKDQNVPCRSFHRHVIFLTLKRRRSKSMTQKSPKS